MEQVGVGAYSNSREYLFDELKLLEFYLGLAVIKFRENIKTEEKQANEFSGMYILNEEVDSIIQPIFDKKTNNSKFDNLYKTIDVQKNIISKRILESLSKKIALSFQHVCNIFGLTDFEKQVLLICIAPEIDIKFEKLYSYLQNDITKKKPTIGFILDLIKESTEDKISHRKYFLNESTLFRLHIISFEQTQEIQSILSRPLKVDNHIVNFILEQEELDSNLTFFSELFLPENMVKGNYIQLYEKIEKKLIEDITKKDIDSTNTIFYLNGASGLGKKTLAKSLCSKIFSSLLIVNVKDAISSRVDLNHLSVLIFRQAALSNAIVYVDNFDFLFANKEDSTENERTKIQFKYAILAEFEKYNGVIFLSGEKKWEKDPKRFIKIVDFQFPEYNKRKQIWEFFMPEQHKGKKIIGELADHFKFTPGQIKNSVLSAKSLNSKESIETGDIYNGCYMQCNEKLQTLATKITKKHSLSDIVLQDEKKQQLKEIIAYVKNRNTVYFEWGFAEKTSSTDGLNILFSGESGTGKTMAANIIAKELNLDIYKIDLSSVVSKYIGETEKNLDRVFKEAQTSNAVLFFDEADALFGKRSEVKDAHDRYANVEIDYLLQKLEEHREIVILASNLAQNVDAAFARRMHFRVEFEFPDKKNRLEIWEKVFPKKAPLDKNVDFEFISKFEMTGGNIKNIALDAAFMAAEEKSNILIKHLISATKKEFQKIGKPVIKSDFDVYYD